MKFLTGISAVLLIASCFTLQAQQPTKRVALQVVALDSAGQAVPDLTASDFKVYDNGSQQQIVSVRMNKTGRPSALVVLFDLLNTNFSSRGEIWDIMKTSVSRLPADVPLYLYLLVEDGSLYAVHGLPAPGTAQTIDDSWVKNIKPLLDTAMQQTVQLRPQDLRNTSPIGLTSRFDTTLKALDEMRSRMDGLQGPKELLWVTYGFPSSIRLAGTGWWDGGPTLRQIGMRFVESGVTLYTADPGLNLEHGVLNRDTLDILTGATGGRAFPTVNLSQAINQAEADARTNYRVEYEPSARNWDGKYHKLKVVVARKGIHVQTEHGYYAVQGS
jgi:VWFA-related protein